MVERVETNQAPRALGPYSQGIICPPGRALLFVSGQLPIDPQTNKFIEGDIQALTRQVLENIQAILLAGGSDLEKVIRVDIFLLDLKKDFANMNQEYGRYFKSQTPPARQTVQVAALPLDSPIEISCIAMR